MLKIKNLSFTFPEREVFILSAINLEIYPGEKVAIVGRNGSGKSTLARLFNGLLFPTQGEVEVDGIAVMENDQLYQVRQKVGMIFQNPENQIVGTTVEDDVAFALENLGIPREEMLERVEKTLRSLSLWHKREEEPHNLSGGEKQRLAIASVMVMEPDYLVLDEPTAMLDPAGRKQVMDMILNLNNKGITIILISHHMEEVLQMDRVIYLKAGKIAFDGKSEDFFLSSHLKDSRIVPPPLFELQKKLQFSSFFKDYRQLADYLIANYQSKG
jgi:energy-coupling factor transport system ATP-binding protein